MTDIYLNITTTSPVLLSDGPPAGNLTTTLNYIPGSTLRGVLAQRYQQIVGTPGESLFNDLFLSGRVIFDHAHTGDAQVIPQSARSCKYESGFNGEGAAHGVADLLLTDSSDGRCPRCGKAMDYFQGYYIDIFQNGYFQRKKTKVWRRITTRTAIADQFGTADSGKLFSQEVIEEGQSFIGHIKVDEALKPQLERLVYKRFEASIGRARSRGQGWVTIAPCDPIDLALSPVSQRARQFKDKNGYQLLAVTMLTDGIFCDDYLRDITLPSIDHIKDKEIIPEQWEPNPCEAYADTRLVSGFQGPPWNLPREPRLAVTAGSVIVFRAIGKVDQPQYPTHSGEVRIGERTDEGFGRSVLWHPFHLYPQPEKGGVSHEQ